MDKPISSSSDKSKHRAALRALSYPEKVRVVVELQKMAAPILKARGKTVHIWPLT